MSGVEMAPIAAWQLFRVRALDLVACPNSLPTDWACIDLNLIGPGADLTYSNLSGLDLSNMNLESADLYGADLSSTVLTNLRAIELQTSCSTVNLPADWRCVDYGNLAGPSANLSGVRLQWADLSNMNLTNTNFTGANLNGTIFTGANTTGANFTATIRDNVIRPLNGIYKGSKTLDRQQVD